MERAYFISPEGEILEVIEHIDYVLSNPFIFPQFRGMHRKDRNTILHSVMNMGWIRVRYNSKNDEFTVQGTPVVKNIDKLKEFLKKNGFIHSTYKYLYPSGKEYSIE